MPTSILRPGALVDAMEALIVTAEYVEQGLVRIEGHTIDKTTRIDVRTQPMTAYARGSFDPEHMLGGKALR
jgi:hypothetical protein